MATAALAFRASPWPRRCQWALAVLATPVLFWLHAQYAGARANAADMQALWTAYEARAPRLEPRTRPESSADYKFAFAKQQLLLERDWGRLASALAPATADVELLDLDVDAASSAVRITGVAPTRVRAVEYTAGLARRLRDGRARLASVEATEQGIRFKVLAEWVP